MASTDSSIPHLPDSRPLEGRTAIVTGSSRGIGRAVAAHLASLAAKVAINYISNSTQADAVAAEINSLTPNSAITVRADVSDPSHVKSLFDAAETAFNSRVYILVNSAAVIDDAHYTIAEIPVEEFDKVFSVNARGTFLCCREAANRLKRGGGGRVILLSSTGVATSPPGHGAYIASKAAIETMTKVLAKELKGTGITVNSVAPGPVPTDMHFAGRTREFLERLIELCPLERLATTEDIARVVRFLVTDASEWINGQVVRLNGRFA